MLAAGDKAIAKVRAEAEKEGVSSFIFGWAPTVDGDVLPVHSDLNYDIIKVKQ